MNSTAVIHTCHPFPSHTPGGALNSTVFTFLVYYIIKSSLDTFRWQPLYKSGSMFFSLPLSYVCVFVLQVVSGFEVTRRILVDLEGISLRRKWLAGLEPENVHMMIGRSIAGECWWINVHFLNLCLSNADFKLHHFRLHDH